MHRFQWFRAAAIVAITAWGTSRAAAVETRGPAFGSNRYAASIRDDDVDHDVDDYVAALVRGDRLTVQVKIAKGSTLVPVVEVIGPDGATRQVPVILSRDGRTWTVKNYAADMTGEWAFRIRGAGGSQGDYTVAFRTTAAPSPAKSKITIDAAGTRDVAFEAIDGSLADIGVTWKKNAAPVTIAGLLDPSGADALHRTKDDPVVVVKGTTATVRGLVLHRGHGAYTLRLAGADGAAAAATVSLRVRAPARPAGKKFVELSDAEPCVTPRSTPYLGIAGQPVSVRGERLVPGVRVFFGDSEAVGVTYLAGGTEIWATPPEGTPGSVVALSAVAPDGQACVRNDWFAYAVVPTVATFTRADGSPAPGWNAAGGLDLRVTGTSFRYGLVVRFPGGAVATPQIVSPTELTVTSPAGPTGIDRVYVVDEWNRTGETASTFHVKAAPVFGAAPFSPRFVAENQEATITVLGTGFDFLDVVLLDGTPVQAPHVSATERRFTLPARDAGSYFVTLRDRYGYEVTSPALRVKPAPRIDSVTVVAGSSLGGTNIPIRGGTTLRVDGADFDATDEVTLGGTAVTISVTGYDSFTFVAPAAPAGPADIEMTDAIGQSGSFTEAVRYVGFEDVSADRLPAAGGYDDWRAARGALADVDGDGDDDLVLVAPRGSAPGTRESFARLLVNDGAGVLADVSDSAIPAVGSDSTGEDDWNTSALAIGDLDGDGDLDLAIAGVPPGGSARGAVRLFSNDGGGSFVFDEYASPLSSARAAIYAYDEYGYAHTAVSARNVAGTATALAIGDIDGDGANDVVLGTDMTESETTILDPRYVDFYRDPPFIYSWYVNYPVNTTTTHSATRVYRNALGEGNGFEEVTDDVLPRIDSSSPALAARDLALVDIDNDGDLDLITAWGNPTTVDAGSLASGPGNATVATRVLRNSGGRFTDVTGSWMPAASGDDWLQAERIAVADLTGDGRPDLVLLCSWGLDAWKGVPTRSAPALRILRNTGSSFQRVAGALPALPSGEDLRGTSVVVHDVDGDGLADLVVTTQDRISGRSSLRLLLQTAGTTFLDAGSYLPSTGADSGQAEDLLIGDLGGDNAPTLLLLDLTAPDASADGAVLRALDWKR